MIITDKIKKELNEYAHENPQFTYALVFREPTLEGEFDFTGHKTYMEMHDLKDQLITDSEGTLSENEFAYVNLHQFWG
jgi:hypothetical protein